MGKGLSLEQFRDQLETDAVQERDRLTVLCEKQNVLLAKRHQDIEELIRYNKELEARNLALLIGNRLFPVSANEKDKRIQELEAENQVLSTINNSQSSFSIGQAARIAELENQLMHLKGVEIHEETKP